ncbi:PIG-L family deacetylase [Kibdelosporangium persicum]|uniref:GlcNAc-PI de-N-acetylase n=1 Tax=Kibdelosporangium persicum TaxID=2698649 RepID=A0ABX2F1R0_9PSEU|nr:PIG-L family deacetylase [Kibdelosporangium persicum]NRN65271.1 GlcNAc-PI de-N-acetylase [Kibdelosporangium persicum]
MPHPPGNNRRVPVDLKAPSWAKDVTRPRDRNRALAAPSTGSYVTILAHSDDELLFINPDLQPAITAGLPVRTIYLTADQNNGWPEGGLTREQLSARLHQGTRNAYASLAGVPSDWAIDTMTVAGRIIERNTLNGAQHIQLLWINLPDGGDALHPDALLNLWNDPGFSSPTIVPEPGPVTQVQHYTGQELHNVLVELLTMYQPTTIRIQDPAPDGRYWADHIDHIAATYHAQLAVRAYEGPDATGQCLLFRYRCYNTSVSPVNVFNPLYEPKRAAYFEYKALDPLTGDGFDVNLARNYQRFPVTEPFVIKDGTGALYAVVVGGDNVIAWRQNAGGATWSAPATLISGLFAPGVAMELNADGTVQLAVLDLLAGDIKTTRQTAPGAGFGAWTSIGAPDGALGVPCFGRNTDNCLELYVLNASGGISNAFQTTPNGSVFDGWYDVGGGPDVIGQPTVINSSTGLLNLFADSNGWIKHWTQPPGGGTSVNPNFPAVETVGTPSPVLQNNDTAILIIREHGDGTIGTSREQTPGGTWSGLAHIGGHGGVGPAFGVRTGGTSPRVLAFARNDNYGISMSRQGPTGQFGTWEDLGGYCEIGPAAVLDNAGLVRLLIVGGDCRLYERRQTTAGPSGAFTGWQLAGA